MAYGFTYTLPTITGTHTDFPVVLRAADFPAAAIDGGASSILNGGGNLRAYTSSTKTTQLAVEIVSFVAGGSPDAEVWIKVPSASTGVTIYIEADAVETTQPAVTATYGRNAVWSDGYEGVYHIGEGVTDSTGNGRDLTFFSAPGVEAGPFGNARAFSYSSRQYARSETVFNTTDELSVRIVYKLLSTTFDPYGRLFELGGYATSDGGLSIERFETANTFNRMVWDASTWWSSSSAFPSTGEWQWVTVASNRVGPDNEVYTNGVSSSTNTDFTRHNALTELTIARANRGAFEYSDVSVAKLFVDGKKRSDEWISTEYANQSASGAWGSAGAWADSGGTAGTISTIEADDLHILSGTSTISGTVSYVEEDDTHNAIATSTIVGILSTLEDNDIHYIIGSVGQAVTGTVSYIEENDLTSITGSSTITGSLSYSEDNDIHNLSSNSEVVGYISTLEADDLHSLAGTSTIQGSIAYNEEDDSYSITATSTVTGSISFTEESDIHAMSGVVGDVVTGTVSFTEEDDLHNIAGNSTVSSTLSYIEEDDIYSINGTSSITGNISYVEESDSYSISGTSTVTGTITSVDSDDIYSIVGTSTITGTISYTEENDSSTSSVVNTFTYPLGALSVSRIGTTYSITKSSVTYTVTKL